MGLAAGTRLGTHRVLGSLGAGGMARFTGARHPARSRRRAEDPARRVSSRDSPTGVRSEISNGRATASAWP
jgi:hypothetical protein